MEKCVLELAIPVEDGVMSAQTNTEISNLMTVLLPCPV